MQKLFILFIVLLITGCQDNHFIAGSIKNNLDANTKEKIVFWHTYGEEETRIFESQLIPLFEKEHPNIEIEAVRQPYNDQLRSTLISRATAGNIPDVVRTDITWVPGLASLGLLYPLSKMPDFKQIADQLKTPTWQTNIYRQQYYGLPLDVNTKIAIYNRKLLQEAGLSEPPDTIQGLIAAARKIHGTLGMSGLYFWSCASYFLALGGSILNDGNSRATGYLNSSSSIHAVEEMVKLQDEGILSSKYIKGKGDSWGDMLKGRLFMLDDGPWFYSILSNSTDNKINLLEATVPRPFVGPSVIGGENLAILKGTRHLQAAWTFIKWMASVEAESQMFKTGLIPTNANVAVPDSLKENPFIMSTLEGIKHPYLRPPIRQSEIVDGIFEKHMVQIFDKKIAVKQGLDAAAAEIDAVLKQ